MVEIHEYHDREDHSPFREWVDRLNAEAARKVTVAVYRIGLGNFSNVKGVGSGVFECKIDFGPGYRLYFGKHGERIVILLGGGTKHGQKRILNSQSPAGTITRQRRSSNRTGRYDVALTRDFRETVQARVRRDPTFRKGLLRDAVDALLAGEVALGKELLRDYINATVGFPKLAEHTKIHVKTLHQMFGPQERESHGYESL